MHKTIAFTFGFGAALIAGCGGGGGDPATVSSAGSIVWPPVSSALASPPRAFAVAKNNAASGALRAFPISTSDELFDWVEQMFPTFFPTHQATLTAGPWVYRAYPSTGTAIGVNDNKIYVVGGAFGAELLLVGSTTDFDTSPLTQAKDFLAAFDASLATGVPTSGAASAEFLDGCSLDNGYTKPVAIATFDQDPVDAVESAKFRIGSARTAVQVIADRTINNSDGTTRRELDIQYQINFADGTTETNAKQTLIWGSSFGSTLAGGTACSAPTNSQSWRIFGNREVLQISMRPINQRQQRFSLATGAPLASVVDYSKFVQLRIADPSNFAKYAVVTGPGLPSAGLKLVSARIQRDDPLFAGKRGNFVDWKDTDPFRFCRADASSSNIAANVADCVRFGASGNGFGAFNNTPFAADSSFDSLGFVSGGTYRIAVHNDDGWKTVNGQATQTPIAVHTATLNSLPYNTVALAGTDASTDQFPRITTSLTPVQVASVIRNKASSSLSASWSGLGTLTDTTKFGWGDVYSFTSGRATATTNFWPQSRAVTIVYPSTGALSIASFTIPAAASALATPTYSEFGVEMVNRNGGRIHSLVTFE